MDKKENIHSILAWENALIRDAVINRIKGNDFMHQITEHDYNEANKLLSDGLAEEVHSKCILALCLTYLRTFKIENPIQYLVGNYSESIDIPVSLELELIPSICEQLHISFLNSKFELKKSKFIRAKSKSNLIEKGAVYTDSRITDEIVYNTISSVPNILIPDFKILDFACGTGRFYSSIVKELQSKFHICPDLSITLLIHAIDIDSVAINITRLKAFSLLESKTIENLNAISQNILLKNGLIFEDVFFPNEMALSGNDLQGHFRAGYDVIVSNPPYLVLKPNKSKLNEASGQNIIRQVQYFRGCGHYIYSLEGMLNLYQLSIEAMLSMLKPGGELGVICPSTLFADVSASMLRKHLLCSHHLRSIRYFGEKDQLFENVTQATSIFYLQKLGSTKTISVQEGKDKFDIPLKLVKELFPDNLEMPTISKMEWNILAKMASAPTLKNFSEIRNRRGELDLTLCNEYITTERTPYRLVRGNMLGDIVIKDINGEFVKEEFVGTKAQDYIKFDFKRKRLVCQQISNMSCSKRLKFIYCDENDILGNSCNYISAESETLKKLFLILNSGILNWRFKITSSNNHINNYEIDQLPLPDLNIINPDFTPSSQSELDNYIGTLFGLSKQEIEYISTK